MAAPVSCINIADEQTAMSSPIGEPTFPTEQDRVIIYEGDEIMFNPYG